VIFGIGTDNIQNLVGGGQSNEWTNFANASNINLNAENYFGFTGIIGNGTIDTLNIGAISSVHTHPFKEGISWPIV